MKKKLKQKNVSLKKFSNGIKKRKERESNWKGGERGKIEEKGETKVRMWDEFQFKLNYHTCHECHMI